MTLTLEEKQSIETLVDQLKKEHKKTIPEKPVIEPKPPEPEKPDYAENLLRDLLKQLQPQQPGPTQNPQNTINTTPPATPDRIKIAQLMMTAQKKIMLLSIMLFILPILTIFITMMNLDIIAGTIALISIIYPAFLFAQSTRTQAYLQQKYGLKPSFLLRQQTTIPGQPHTKKQQEETFI